MEKLDTSKGNVRGFGKQEHLINYLTDANISIDQATILYTIKRNSRTNMLDVDICSTVSKEKDYLARQNYLVGGFNSYHQINNYIKKKDEEFQKSLKENRILVHVFSKKTQRIPEELQIPFSSFN